MSAPRVPRARSPCPAAGNSPSRPRRPAAPPASGPAGLYDVTVAANGTVRGTSETGSELAGQLAAVNGAPDDGPVVVTASSADQDVKLDALARQVRPGAYRWIVSSDHKVYGATGKVGRQEAWEVRSRAARPATRLSRSTPSRAPTPRMPPRGGATAMPASCRQPRASSNDALDAEAAGQGDLTTISALDKALEGGIKAAGEAGCIVLF